MELQYTDCTTLLRNWRLLRRLGRRACTIFLFCAARDDGLLVSICGVFGDIEYEEEEDDGELLAVEFDCRRWQWS